MAAPCIAEDLVSPAPASKFEAAHIARNPFERIDAKHLAERASVVTLGPGGPDLSKLFRVSGLSKDRLAIAVINGRAFAENETFIARGADKEYRVVVKRVGEAGADLECDGMPVHVPITRNEVAREIREATFKLNEIK
jgi:hypothetical protein